MPPILHRCESAAHTVSPVHGERVGDPPRHPFALELSYQQIRSVRLPRGDDKFIALHIQIVEEIGGGQLAVPLDPAFEPDEAGAPQPLFAAKRPLPSARDGGVSVRGEPEVEDANRCLLIAQRRRPLRRAPHGQGERPIEIGKPFERQTRR